MASNTWIVWHPEGGEEGPAFGSRFKASSPQDAAEQWGKRHEWTSNEYTLDQEPEIVNVILAADGHCNAKKFRVSAQTSRDYYATEIND